jgi:hypothetical protein
MALSMAFSQCLFEQNRSAGREAAAAAEAAVAR